MAAIIITVNYLPFHCTQSVTGSCRSQVNKERSNNLGQKNGGCDSAGGISAYFPLILTVGGVQWYNIDLTQHQCLRVPLVFSNVLKWTCIQPQWDLVDWDFVEYKQLYQAFRLDGLNTHNGSNGGVAGRNYPWLMWHEKTRNVFVSMFRVDTITQQIVWTLNWITTKRFPRSTARTTPSWEDII